MGFLKTLTMSASVICHLSPLFLTLRSRENLSTCTLTSSRRRETQKERTFNKTGTRRSPRTTKRTSKFRHGLSGKAVEKSAHGHDAVLRTLCKEHFVRYLHSSLDCSSADV